MNRSLLLWVTLLLHVALVGTASAADSFQVDPIHSVIIFRVRHMDVGVFYGRFNTPQGTFTYDEQDPSRSSFQFSVKAQDFDSANVMRDQRVRGPELLDAKAFPAITFKSKTVKADGDGKLQVAGDLSLHGQTRAVAATLEKIGAGGGRMGFEGRLAIKCTDFGMKGIAGVGDEVRLIVAFEGVKVQ